MQAGRYSTILPAISIYVAQFDILKIESLCDKDAMMPCMSSIWVAKHTHDLHRMSKSCIIYSGWGTQLRFQLRVPSSPCCVQALGLLSINPAPMCSSHTYQHWWAWQVLLHYIRSRTVTEEMTGSCFVCLKTHMHPHSTVIEALATRLPCKLYSRHVSRCLASNSDRVQCHLQFLSAEFAVLGAQVCIHSGLQMLREVHVSQWE